MADITKGSLSTEMESDVAGGKALPSIATVTGDSSASKPAPLRADVKPINLKLPPVSAVPEPTSKVYPSTICRSPTDTSPIQPLFPGGVSMLSPTSSFGMVPGMHGGMISPLGHPSLATPTGIFGPSSMTSTPAGISPPGIFSFSTPSGMVSFDPSAGFPGLPMGDMPSMFGSPFTPIAGLGRPTGIPAGIMTPVTAGAPSAGVAGMAPHPGMGTPTMDAATASTEAQIRELQAKIASLQKLTMYHRDKSDLMQRMWVAEKERTGSVPHAHAYGGMPMMAAPMPVGDHSGLAASFGRMGFAHGSVALPSVGTSMPSVVPASASHASYASHDGTSYERDGESGYERTRRYEHDYDDRRYEHERGGRDHERSRADDAEEKKKMATRPTRIGRGFPSVLIDGRALLINAVFETENFFDEMEMMFNEVCHKLKEKYTANRVETRTVVSPDGRLIPAEPPKRIFIPKCIVWLMGPPGCGKTSVATTVLDHCSLPKSAYIDARQLAVDLYRKSGKFSAEAYYETLFFHVLNGYRHRYGIVVDGFLENPQHGKVVEFLGRKLKDLFSLIRFVVLAMKVDEKQSVERQVNAHLGVQSPLSARKAIPIPPKVAQSLYVECQTRCHEIVNILKKAFSFQEINANGDLERTREHTITQIERQMNTKSWITSASGGGGGGMSMGGGGATGGYYYPRPPVDSAPMYMQHMPRMSMSSVGSAAVGYDPYAAYAAAAGARGGMMPPTYPSSHSGGGGMMY